MASHWLSTSTLRYVERCNKCAAVMGKINVNIYCSAVAAMYQLLPPPCLFAPLCTRRRMCRLFNLHPSSGSAASPSAGAPSPEQSRNSTGTWWRSLRQPQSHAGGLLLHQVFHPKMRWMDWGVSGCEGRGRQGSTVDVKAWGGFILKSLCPDAKSCPFLCMQPLCGRGPLWRKAEAFTWGPSLAPRSHLSNGTTGHAWGLVFIDSGLLSYVFGKWIYKTN